MNVIICTDSTIIYNRLTSILSELSEINIAGITKDLDEAKTTLSKNNAQVFIIAFHNIQKKFFTKLKEIKKCNAGLVVIVLNNNPSVQYITQWKTAGADYIFDQAMNFNSVVDVLSNLIYKNLLEKLKSTSNTGKTLKSGKMNENKLK